MPKEDNDFLDEILSERKKNKEFNTDKFLIDLPSNFDPKSVKMPHPKIDWDEVIERDGVKGRRRDFVDRMPLLKKGGSIDLSKCKINTAKKNSSSGEW